MRVVIQRVKHSKVFVGAECVAEVAAGLLVFVGIGRGDTLEDAEYMAKKIANLRIFEDGQGRMNRALQEAGGGVLSVPQFTLYADTSRGNRPGFESAADPETGKRLWQELNRLLAGYGLTVAQGIFGAKMSVAIVNDGPVTIWLDSKERAA